MSIVTNSNSDMIDFNNVKLVDVADNVYLYHSKEFDSHNGSEWRGVIFVADRTGGEKRLYFKGFPFCIELTDTDAKDYFEKNDISFDACKFYESIEGTLIKVFNVDGRWYTSTNRRLDAFRSKWASRVETFGSRFAAALRLLDPSICDGTDDKKFLDAFYAKYLDATKRYAFVLHCSEEERIVCDAEQLPTVTHVGTFDENGALDGDLASSHVPPFLTNPRVNFNDIDSMVSQLREDVNYWKRVPGFIGFHVDGRVIKIVSSRYKERFDARGNVSSIRFRYLMLRKDSHRLNLLMDMYRSIREDAPIIEDAIYDLSKHLHALYMAKYINGAFDLVTTQEESKMLNVIHDQYMLTKIRTTPKRINDILTIEACPVRLNRLLKERCAHRIITDVE